MQTGVGQVGSIVAAELIIGATVYQLCYTNRIPLPIRLPMTDVLRWGIFELLEWVEAGCPGRAAGISARALSGKTQRPV